MPAIGECSDYTGRDLEAMSFAANYHRWILQLFRPLGKRVVEVGAGTGAFSELLLENQLDSLALVEPSKGMFDILKAQLDKLRPRVRVTTYNRFFGQVANEIRESQLPDSIIYVNVLEHIATTKLSWRLCARHSSILGAFSFLCPRCNGTKVVLISRWDITVVTARPSLNAGVTPQVSR